MKWKRMNRDTNQMKHNNSQLKQNQTTLPYSQLDTASGSERFKIQNA